MHDYFSSVQTYEDMLWDSQHLCIMHISQEATNPICLIDPVLATPWHTMFYVYYYYNSTQWEGLFHLFVMIYDLQIYVLLNIECLGESEQ